MNLPSVAYKNDAVVRDGKVITRAGQARRWISPWN